MKDVDGNHKTFCCVGTACCDDCLADNGTALNSKPVMATLDQEAKPFTTIGLVGPTGASVSSDPVRTVTASLTATYTTIPTGPAIGAGDPLSSNSFKRFSTIGIAVGVTSGITILAPAVILVVWRRRRQPELNWQPPTFNDTHESQEQSPDLSEVGFPPRELYNRNEHMDRIIPAETPEPPTPRQEISAGLSTVPELDHARHRDT